MKKHYFYSIPCLALTCALAACSDDDKSSSAKAGHNCLKITCNIYQISCLCNSGAVQTVSSTCFTDSHNRRVIFIFMSEITDYGTC